MQPYSFEIREFLESDATLLYREYLGEEKTKYEILFRSYFFSNEITIMMNPDNHRTSFISKIKKFNDIDVQIEIRLVAKTKTYFISISDLEQYAVGLRKNDNFREFTKLCFWIEENISPK